MSSEGFSLREALLLFDQALHPRARLPFGLEAERLEYLVEPLDLSLRLLPVLLKHLLRLAIGGLAGHLVEGFQQSLLSPVDVLQVVFKQLIKRVIGMRMLPSSVVNAPHGAKEKNSAGALARFFAHDAARRQPLGRLL